VTEPAGQPTKPRTWRPMALWTVAMLLALGLIWFVAAAVVPVWQVRSLVAAEEARSHYGALSYKCPVAGDARRRYIDRCVVYLKLPDFIAPHKTTAALMLGGCGYDALPELLREIHASGLQRRAIAAASIGMTGPQGRTASQELASLALTDPEAAVRDTALNALAWLYRDETQPGIDKRLLLLPDAVQFMPVWTKALGDAESRVRLRAALCLEALGKNAKEAIPLLENALKDPDESVRSAAADALKKIRDEEAPK
jgi:hypothetical protein